MIQEFLTPAKWETWNTGHEVFCFRPLTWELAIRGDEATFVITCDHRHYHLMCQIAIWYSRYHPSTASIFPILRFLEKGTRYCVSSKKELPWPSFLYMKKEMMHTHPLFIALLATTPMEDPREWTSEHAGHSSSESWRLITNPSTVQCAGDYHSRRKWRPHCCVIWVGFFTGSLKIRDFSSGKGLPTRKMARNSRWSMIHQVSKVLRNCYQSFTYQWTWQPL